MESDNYSCWWNDSVAVCRKKIDFPNDTCTNCNNDWNWFITYSADSRGRYLEYIIGRVIFSADLNRDRAYAGEVGFLRKAYSGRSKILIANGIIQVKTLKKVRLTVDQLEMNLRQQSVQRIEDVQWATLEANGRVALVLKEDAQPITKREFKQLTSMLEQTLNELNLYSDTGKIIQQKKAASSKQQETIFAEVQRKAHKNTPPKQLR